MTVFVGKDGGWVEATALYGANGGEFIPSDQSHASLCGRWTKQLDTVVPVNPLSLAITALSYTTGGPGQGELHITGSGLDRLARPAPYGAFYKLAAGGFGDAFDNFGSMTGHNLPGSEAPTTAGGDVTLDGVGNWLQFPTGDAGIMALAFRYPEDTPDVFSYSLSFQFKVEAWPADGGVVPLFHIPRVEGQPSFNSYGVGFNLYARSDGVVVMQHSDSSNWISGQPQLDGAFEYTEYQCNVVAGQWCGFHVAGASHDPFNGPSFSGRVRTSSGAVHNDRVGYVKIAGYLPSTPAPLQWGRMRNPALPFSNTEVPWRYGAVSFRSIHFQNAWQPEVEVLPVINPSYAPVCVFRNLASLTDFPTSILKYSDTDMVVYVPPSAPVGEYTVRVMAGELSTAALPFAVRSKSIRTTPLVLDFKNNYPSDDELDRALIRKHNKFGGANGGCNGANVYTSRGTGELILRGCGDNYTGDVLGTDIAGNPSGFNTRIGGLAATVDYFGPASYRVTARIPQVTGVVSAFWTFHYEEGYPGTAVYDSHRADGIPESGNAIDGFYTVRNHEIDIEIPVALAGAVDPQAASYRNANFNTWQGELEAKSTISPTPHGIAMDDGEEHEFRFDWHVYPSAYVDFYLDGVFQKRLGSTVPDIFGRFWFGLWFPSGNIKWAGPVANFEEEYMRVTKLEITPFASEYPYCRNIFETYPYDVFLPFTGDCLDRTHGT